MNKTCKHCGGAFEVTDSDLEFLKKVSPVINGRRFEIPAPTLCPDCRQQRRLLFRNERNLYKRKCDLCKKHIIAIFDENAPFPVYCGDCWWSDKWDPYKYGRDFDFSRPFFDQFRDLLKVVPKVNLLQLNNENCEYSNLIGLSKNSYMSPGSYCVEDCYYCRKSQYSKDCLDCNFVDHSELLISCMNCNKCYDSQHLVNCNNCRNCAYTFDSTGCENCFMCASAVRKKYCIKNEQFSKEEYEKIVEEKLKGSPEALMAEFMKFSKTVPKKALNNINCENCVGDYIQNCKNAVECYDSFDLEDCKYVIDSAEAKDCMDMSMHDKENQFCYEICAGGEKNNLLRFSFCSCVSYDSDYLYTCFYLTESFGCDGFHSKQKNCILNKKYSEEDYQNLRAKIIGHMLKTGEYGEFFPAELSLHNYEEAVANEYFPKFKNERVQRRLSSNSSIRAFASKDEIFECESCGKKYKFLKQELDLLKRVNHPVSDYCAECRHLQLLSLKNPRKLWGRKCTKCHADIQTTYPPDGAYVVYCEECYLKDVY